MNTLFALADAPQGAVDLAIPIGNLVRASNIAEYVGAIFRYGIGIVGLIATVMIVVGGVQWLIAAGDPGKITQAKERITNAVIGLILMLGTTLILNTINPEILKLKALHLPKIGAGALVNWCEDLDQTKFEISPASGSCGERATVAARSSDVVATDDTCGFRTCAEAELACAKLQGGYRCTACGTITDDELEVLGIPENDQGCRTFIPTPAVIGSGRTAVHYDCVFSDDDRLDVNDDVCAFARVDCGQIQTCRDYDDIELAHLGARLKIDGEADVTAGVWVAGEPRHLDAVCSNDPCGIGPCHMESSDALSQIASGLPIIRYAVQDYYDCKSGAAE